MDCISRRVVSPSSIRSDLYAFENVQQSNSMPCVLSVLSSLVQRVVARNQRVAVSFRRRQYEALDGVEVPDMSIERYLERIFKYVHCSPSVFVVAYVYIDRLIQFHPHFRITSLNVHRLLITSVMIASKFVEDLNYKNSHYARVGGLSSEEINRLEMEFLFLMGFRLQVTVNVFESYCCHLEREFAIGERFQIERSLRILCAKDETSMTEYNNQTRSLKMI